MTWYKPQTWFADVEKLNPAQEMISREQGVFINTDAVITYAQAFNKEFSLGFFDWDILDRGDIRSLAKFTDEVF